MLVLTRKAGERLVIGNLVTITITSVHEGHVQLGIDAPRDITIWREEVIERIERRAGQLPDAEPR